MLTEHRTIPTDRILWVGFVKDILKVTDSMGMQPYRIITQPQELEGYIGPLTINFVGRWRSLGQWRQIRDIIKRLNRPIYLNYITPTHQDFL